MNVRFTAWFSERERELIQREADAQATSANYIVRSAIRQFFGMPSHLSRVTPDPPEATTNARH